MFMHSLNSVLSVRKSLHAMSSGYQRYVFLCLILNLSLASYVMRFKKINCASSSRTVKTLFCYPKTFTSRGKIVSTVNVGFELIRKTTNIKVSFNNRAILLPSTLKLLIL